VRRPAGIALVALLGLLTIALLVARAAMAEDAARRDGVSAGLAAVAGAALLSFLLLRRRLAGSNLAFLQAYFAGMLLRLVLLALIGLVVWGGTDWDLRAWLAAVGLSYPLAMAIEGWALSREFARRQPPAPSTTGAKE
jgi:hypothetical protein